MVTQQLTEEIDSLTEMHGKSRMLSQSSVHKWGRPKSATQLIDELSDSLQAYIYAQNLPCLAGLPGKMPLDIFQSHYVEELIPFGVMPALLWPGGRLLAAAFNARCCNGA